jgi:hypothetical protein
VNFLSKILVVNPKNRVLYSKLVDHPWLSEESNFLEPIGGENYVPFRPTQEEDIDQSVIELMESMGIEKKSATQAILTGKFNQSAGLYYTYAYQKWIGIKFELVPAEIIPTTEDSDEVKADDISDELAQVLFRVERSIEPPKEVNLNTTLGVKEKDRFKNGKRKESADPKLKRLMNVNPNSLHQAPLPAGKISSIFPLPDIKQLGKGSTISSIQEEDITEPTSKNNEARPSKFGIRIKNTNQKQIPIDSSLYLKEDNSQTIEITPRTIKFAFNCTSHTKMPPDLFLEKVSNIMDKNDVVWYNNGFLCACEWGDIKFEVEICKLPRMESYGLRMKRNGGDIWDFKKLNGKIIQELESISNTY